MRVGFLGSGRHATNALYPALQPAGVELAATCATTLAHAQRNAVAFGAEQAYDEVDKFLAHPGLDAVIVSVPPSAYGELVTAVLARGLPVFTEKPGGATAADFARIEEASSASEQPVMVGYMKRFARAYRGAKRFVDGDEFGRITSVHCKFVMGPGFGSLRNYIIDNPVHALDLLRFFAGEVADLDARLLTLDDNRHALGVVVGFTSGAVGTLQLATTASFFQENELVEVIGEQHSVTVTNVDTVVCRRPDGAATLDRPNYTVPLKANFTGDVMGFVPELAHFRSVVTGGVPCESDIASAGKTFALAERLWETLAPTTGHG